MKNLKFSIVNIFCFFIVYLSFQNVYQCIKVRKSADKLNRKSTGIRETCNSLSPECSHKRYNFTNIFSNKSVNARDNLDIIKEKLANDLAHDISDRIQNEIENYVVEKNGLFDTENISDKDLTHFRNYITQISEYVGNKATNLLNESLENELERILNKRLNYNNNDHANHRNVNSLESDNETIDEEADQFVDELVDESENGGIDTLNENRNNINKHNDTI